VSGGFGEAALAEGYKAAGDDYNAILIQAVVRSSGRSLCRIPA
jgi:cobalamin-dependent methionine synthase I